MGKTARHKAAAEHIAAFCRKEKYEAEALQTESGNWLVLSNRAFDSDRGTEQDAFAREIQALGGKYMRAPGSYKYNFKQSDRNGALKAWYYRWPQTQAGQ